MDEVLLRQMLERATADEPPIGPVVDRAIFEGGRLRRRRRRTIAGAIGCAAVAAVAGVLVPVLRGPQAVLPPAAAAASSPAWSAGSGRTAHSRAASRTAAASSPSAGCGSFCNDLYLSEYGADFVLDVYKQTAEAGQPVIMFAAVGSTADPGEDWTFTGDATVKKFYQAGLVSLATESHYGADKAYEIEYTPRGVPSGLCMGVPAGQAHVGATLEPCGEGARTVWFSATTPEPGNPVPIMSGLDAGSGDPLVLTYPLGKTPLDVPRVPVYLAPLARGTAASDQRWE